MLLLRDIALHIPPELLQSNICVHVFMPLRSNGNSINRIGCKGIFGMASWFSLQSPLFLAIETDLDMYFIQPTFSRASGSGLKLEQQYCEQLPIITIRQTIIGHLPPVMNLGKRYGWQLKLFL